MPRRLSNRLFALLAICLLSLVGHIPNADAARRALVVGNDSYRQLPALKNARADAQALAKTLEASGFAVSLRLDLSEKEMKSALRAFKAQVAGGDEALFFYSGHAVQLGGANYLLPVDLVGEDEEQVKDEAVSLQRVMDDLQEQKARFALAIIDACRDNPFKGKGRSVATRGLAPTVAASGQMIIFSAGSGQQALDRLGDADRERNGVFTRVLLREIEKPGVSADRLLRNVRAEVVRLAKSIGHEQVPAIYDQAIGDFYFRRDGARAAVPEASAGQVLAGSPAQDIEQQTWEAAKASQSVAALEAYLAEFPDGRHRSLARVEIARMKDASGKESGARETTPSITKEPGAGDEADLERFDVPGPQRARLLARVKKDPAARAVLKAMAGDPDLSREAKREVVREYALSGVLPSDLKEKYARRVAAVADPRGRELPAQANPGGKYAKLLQIMNCPSDRGAYGETRDYGYWSGGGWCGQQGKAGYWVWVAPDWYIWEKQR